MRSWLLLVALIINCAYGQDERFYRKIFTGELFEAKKNSDSAKIRMKSDVYMIDLNHDGIKEGLVTEIRDGVDYLRIVNNLGAELYRLKLSTKGNASRLYKIQVKTISDRVDALILHFYEGYTDYIDFEATARLYFITIEDRDFQKIYSFTGPHFFHEKEKIKNQYWQRKYSVNIVDYNKDGRKEVGTSFNSINRIYFYLGKGNWKKL